MTQRHLVRGAIRLLAILFWVVSTFPIFSWLGEGLLDGDLLWLRYYFFRIATGGFLFSVGVVLWALNAPLSRLLIPFPSQLNCPRCGFLLQALSVPRCPECGIALPKEIVVTAAQSPSTPLPPPMIGD